MYPSIVTPRASQTSDLANRPLLLYFFKACVEGDKNHYTFSGVRKYRGLYYSKVSGIYLNADVNGALNILRKKYGNECIESIVKDAVYTKGVLNTPEVVKLPNRS